MAVQEFTTEELATEEWRPVLGYESVYSVSNLGRVRRDLQLAGCRAGRILEPSRDKNGYPRASLSKSGTHKTMKVHHLIAEAFIGPRPDGYTVNHIDGVKSNNRYTNLEYCTPLENRQHATRMGLIARNSGERNGQSRLTREQVRAIRDAPTLAEARSRASSYGVLAHNAYQIRARRRWKHI